MDEAEALDAAEIEMQRQAVRNVETYRASASLDPGATL